MSLCPDFSMSAWTCFQKLKFNRTTNPPAGGRDTKLGTDVGGWPRARAVAGLRPQLCSGRPRKMWLVAGAICDLTILNAANAGTICDLTTQKTCFMATKSDPLRIEIAGRPAGRVARRRKIAHPKNVEIGSFQWQLGSKRGHPNS